jgi:hypothetical protein
MDVSISIKCIINICVFKNINISWNNVVGWFVFALI